MGSLMLKILYASEDEKVIISEQGHLTILNKDGEEITPAATADGEAVDDEEHK